MEQFITVYFPIPSSSRLATCPKRLIVVHFMKGKGHNLQKTENSNTQLWKQQGINLIVSNIKVVAMFACVAFNY